MNKAVTKEKFTATLIKYIPFAAVPKVVDIIIDHHIVFKISSSRSSKLGDYRNPAMGRTHCISVNHNLNQYAFLITFIHEVAHLYTWNKYRNKVDPHGKEWKLEYRNLLLEFMEIDIFPDDIQLALIQEVNNMFASSGRSIPLTNTLRKYDKIAEPGIDLEHFPFDQPFIYKQRTFVKQSKLRKNYLCICLNNNRKYVFSPLAKVEEVIH